jgi:hypothetical protein
MEKVTVEKLAELVVDAGFRAHSELVAFVKGADRMQQGDKR